MEKEMKDVYDQLSDNAKRVLKMIVDGMVMSEKMKGDK